LSHIELPVARAVLERVPNDAFDSLACVDVFLDRNFIGRSLLEDSTQVAINALGVLTNHHEVEVFWFDAFKRAKRRIQQAHRPDVGVQVHLAAHAQQNFPRMKVGGHARIAKRADEDGIEIAGQGREAVRWDRNFVGEIAVGSPVERRQFDRGPCGIYDLYGLRDDFFPDPVPGNYGNMLGRAHAGNVSTALWNS
jgi:hypothetical protein